MELLGLVFVPREIHQYVSSKAVDTFFVVFSSSESVLDRSKASVSTQLTTWGDLASSVCQDNRPGPSSLRETSEPGGVVLEGWQKFWEQPPESAQALGIAPANIKWLKTNETYGLFERASKYKNVRGEMAERKLFKEKMEFRPPHLLWPSRELCLTCSPSSPPLPSSGARSA